MSPRGPNEKIIAIEVVNGGEISGSNVPRRGRETRRAAGRPATVKANRKPTSVPRDADQHRQQQAVPERAQVFGRGEPRPADARQRELPVRRLRPATAASARDRRRTAPAAARSRAGRIPAATHPAGRHRPVRSGTTSLRRPPSAGVQHFGHPAIDDALAVGAGPVGRRSRRSWRPSAPRPGSGSGFTSGGRQEVDLRTWRQLRLHGGDWWPSRSASCRPRDSWRP
jgi:hypothetical protein